jgi:hypothetical protein
VFSLWRQRRRPWRPPGRYGASTRPVAAFRGFAWSHRYDPSGDVPRAVSTSRHGHRNRRRICYILFFRRLESKLFFILLLYQFIDSIESLRPPPPPTTRPPRICAGSGVSIKSAPREGAEAHHGGVVCGLCCVAETRKNVLFLRRKTYGGIVFCSRRNANRG